MESMTGFSVKNCEDKDFILNLKVKSLNSKYLEVKANLPSEFFHLEKKVREYVQKEFSRGGIEVNASYLNLNLSNSVKKLKPWVKSFKKTAKDLDVSDSLSLDSVMKRSANMGHSSLTKSNEKMILKTLDESLKALKKERVKEGLSILKVLNSDLKICLDFLSSIDKSVQKAKDVLKVQLNKKAEQIKVDIPEERLAVELSLLIEKSDVGEELERLKIHFSEFKRILNSKESLKGKKLDFYCQELNREANTIGSKIKNAEVIKLLVSLKGALDRLREQVQNVQ